MSTCTKEVSSLVICAIKLQENCMVMSIMCEHLSRDYARMLLVIGCARLFHVAACLWLHSHGQKCGGYECLTALAQIGSKWVLTGGHFMYQEGLLGVMAGYWHIKFCHGELILRKCENVLVFLNIEMPSVVENGSSWKLGIGLYYNNR